MVRVRVRRDPGRAGVTVPDEERLFRFIAWEDYDPTGPRITSRSFRTRSHAVSVNRESVWDLPQHRRVCPAGYGIASLRTGELRGASAPPDGGQARAPLDAIPDPLAIDPLLGIPNPAHCNVSRPMTEAEARRVARLLAGNLHDAPAAR